LDKSSFCGGNSTKATSGINGAATRSQKAKGIEDSKELFTSDTLKGGAKKPEIVKVLCENSGADVEWLMDKFNLDLSLLARLGGHSAPRTNYVVVLVIAELPKPLRPLLGGGESNAKRRLRERSWQSFRSLHELRRL